MHVDGSEADAEAIVVVGGAITTLRDSKVDIGLLGAARTHLQYETAILGETHGPRVHGQVQVATVDGVNVSECSKAPPS